MVRKIEEVDNKSSVKIKLQYYKDKNLQVHLSLENGWLNGTIIDFLEDYFLLNELKDGEIPVTYSEVRRIEPYKTKEE
jgi:hypothetical protein